MEYYVYILISKVDQTFYTGQSQDLPKRLKLHNAGLVRSTKSKAPYELGYFEVYPTRSAAMWREWELKRKWNTERKRKLVEVSTARE